jgi:hypothetical protein
MTKTTKHAACSNCMPEGGAILIATFDYDEHERTPVWECNNCGEQIARRTQRRPDESTPLTQSQLDAITEIQRCKTHDQGRVIKSLKVKNGGRSVYVSITVGSINDEGTMLAIIGRDRGHFAIGRGGKIEVLGTRDDVTNSNLKKYPLIYGWSH